MAKEAVASWSAAKHATLNMAVAHQIKCAGSMSRDQMQRLVEATNQEAYRMEHTTKTGSHRVVDFRGGLARFEDVVKQATGLPDPMTFHDMSDYLSPPAASKTASWDEIMGVEGIEKKAARHVEPYSGITLEKLASRLEHAVEQARSEFDVAQLSMPSVRDELVGQMKRAHREGASLGEIAQLLGHVDPDPDFLKAAFELAHPVLSRGHTEESYASSIKEAHAVGTPNLEHPLALAYRELIDASTKVAAAREVLIETEQALERVHEKQASFGRTVAEMGEGFGDGVLVRTLTPAFSPLGHLRDRTGALPAFAATTAATLPTALGLTAFYHKGRSAGEREAQANSEQNNGESSPKQASLSDAVFRQGPNSPNAAWTLGFNIPGTSSLFDRLDPYNIGVDLGIAGVTAAGALAAYHAGKWRGRKQRAAQEAAAAEVPPAAVPPVVVEPKTASAANATKSFFGGFRRAGDAVSKHVGQFAEGVAGTNSMAHRIGRNAGKVIQYAPHVAGGLLAYRGYQHADAALDSPLARKVKSFLPFTDENKQKEMEIRNFYGSPMYGSMPGYPGQEY